MKRIIIATDFSPHSQKTIEFVMGIVKDTTAPHEILLLNTYMVKETDPLKVIGLNDELKLASRRKLEHERSELQKKMRNPNIKIEIATHMGSLPNVVSQLIKANPVELVAMGKDGGRNVENVSVVLRQNGCSLLVTYLSP